MEIDSKFFFELTELSFSMNKIDAPDQVQLHASTLTPLTGTSVNLTCAARASPAANYRFININGSNETTVQNSASAIYKTPSLDYKDYNNYKAIYRCIPYNMYGNGPAQIITLDIQGKAFLSLLNIAFRNCLRFRVSLLNIFIKLFLDYRIMIYRWKFFHDDHNNIPICSFESFLQLFTLLFNLQP